MNALQITWLADGRRLHLNHGPIDLIVQAFGEGTECQKAYRQAIGRFETILTELVQELALLRQPVAGSLRAFKGATASRMEHAVYAHRRNFITPMAAVAGSVADEILAALCDGRCLDKAYVNNGGDCALHLSPGQSLVIAIAGTGEGLSDRIVISSGDVVRGVATSGWRGRSHSLGIADAVTVLAQTGAAADAAATIIGNAVDLPHHPAILRVRAASIHPDSDLGARLVTKGVGSLSPRDVETALSSGLAMADDLKRHGLIVACALFLRGKFRVCGDVSFADEIPIPNKVAAHG